MLLLFSLFLKNLKINIIGENTISRLNMA
jgi:hypothetical protein